MQGATNKMKFYFKNINEGVVYYDNYTKSTPMCGDYHNGYWVIVEGVKYESCLGETEHKFKERIEKYLNMDSLEAQLYKIFTGGEK